MHFEAADQAGQQLAAGGAVLGDQQVEMPAVLRACDALSAMEVLAQPLNADAPFDEPQHVDASVVRLEHDLREVDEPPDGRLDVAAATALELLALSLCRTVGGAEHPV